MVETAVEVPEWKARIRAIRVRLLASLVSGFGGFATIFALGQANSSLHVALLIAPFGASCVLVFALPQSPLAQPKNVVFGHVISATAGLTVQAILGHGPVALGVGVGTAIAAMQITGTLHPPAGADPIVIIAAAASWSFLATPTLIGAAMIVVVGWSYHRWVSGCSYPHRPIQPRQPAAGATVTADAMVGVQDNSGRIGRDC